MGRINPNFTLADLIKFGLMALGVVKIADMLHVDLLQVAGDMVATAAGIVGSLL